MENEEKQNLLAVNLVKFPSFFFFFVRIYLFRQLPFDNTQKFAWSVFCV